MLTKEMVEKDLRNLAGTWGTIWQCPMKTREEWEKSTQGRPITTPKPIQEISLNVCSRGIPLRGLYYLQSVACVGQPLVHGRPIDFSEVIVMLSLFFGEMNFLGAKFDVLYPMKSVDDWSADGALDIHERDTILERITIKKWVGGLYSVYVHSHGLDKTLRGANQSTCGGSSHGSPLPPYLWRRFPETLALLATECSEDLSPEPK